MMLRAPPDPRKNVHMIKRPHAEYEKQERERRVKNYIIIIQQFKKLRCVFKAEICQKLDLMGPPLQQQVINIRNEELKKRYKKIRCLAPNERAHLYDLRY